MVAKCEDWWDKEGAMQGCQGRSSRKMEMGDGESMELCT